ncbi:hypothetical protein OAY00_03585 [Burkholderiales bacterium]|jgi:hypothetical protein|nr:hypothetical protein [Burkholderiales bacterium]
MRFLTYFFGGALAVVFTVLVVNLIVDPLCYFGASNQLITKKYLFDERAQKTNFVKSKKGQFDTLLLGSSRTAIIDWGNIGSKKIFNYSVSGMLPTEYSGFINNFKQSNSVETVVLGMDFFSSRSGEAVENKKSPGQYLTEMYALDLLSYDTLHYSRVSISCSIKKICRERSYTKNFARTMVPVTSQELTQKINKQILQYREGYYGAHTYPDPNLLSYLNVMRKENPKVEFVVFTTPVSHRLWQLLIEQDLYDEYVDWLALIFNQFGRFYNFMGVNSITTNPANYIDAHHFTSNVGDLIINKLYGVKEGVPPDFGVEINAEEINRYRTQDPRVGLF